MIVWNGKDTEVFLKIVESVGRNQTVEVTTADGAVERFL